MSVVGADPLRIWRCGGGVAAYHRYLGLAGIATESRNVISGKVVTTETWESVAARRIPLDLPTEMLGGGSVRPSLTRHDQATVFAPEWLVITKDNELLVEQMTHNPKTLRKKATHLPALTARRYLLDLPAQRREISEACALIGGSANYYHWLIDHLPRVGILAKAADLRELRLLVNADLARFQRESLTVLGIHADQLITLSEGAVARCRAVWVPTFVSRLTAMHSFVPGCLRRMYLKDDMKRAPRRRLFVSRSGAKQRRLINEVELLDRLLPLGFEVIRSEEINFIDQVAAFAAAEVVVGPHGAGLTNTIFSPQSVSIFELGYPQYPSTFFSGMARQLGQRFVRINGEAVPATLPVPHTWDFRIDVDETVRTIAAAMAS